MVSQINAKCHIILVINFILSSLLCIFLKVLRISDVSCNQLLFTGEMTVKCQKENTSSEDGERLWGGCRASLMSPFSLLAGRQRLVTGGWRESEARRRKRRQGQGQGDQGEQQRHRPWSGTRHRQGRNEPHIWHFIFTGRVNPPAPTPPHPPSPHPIFG